METTATDTTTPRTGHVRTGPAPTPAPTPAAPAYTTGRPSGTIRTAAKKKPGVLAQMKKRAEQLALVSGDEIAQKAERVTGRAMAEVSGVVAATSRIAAAGSLGLAKATAQLVDGATPEGILINRMKGTYEHVGPYEVSEETETVEVYSDTPGLSGTFSKAEAYRKRIPVRDEATTAVRAEERVLIPLRVGLRVQAVLVLDEATATAYVAR